MRHLIILGLIAVIMFASALQSAAQNWVIVPGRTVGPIDANTGEAKLIELFGKTNVKRMAIDIGEGETMPGTVLFPNDARRRAYVLWRDAATRTQPESITIRDKNTFWKTDKGITIGTSLLTIERLNGSAFVLAGFAWDYSGTVMHANGGKLSELGRESGEEILDRTLTLRLEPLASARGSREYKAVMGDGRFASDNPSMKKLNPRVYEMIIEFAQ